MRYSSVVLLVVGAVQGGQHSPGVGGQRGFKVFTMTPAFQQDGVTMYHGDCLDVLRELPAESVHCVVTSPPYWGLRSYLDDGHDDKHHELGLEATPDEFVQKMVEVFREVRRVLRGDGVMFCNLGDSYGPGKQLQGIPWKVAFALQNDGWVLRQDIIWAKK